MRFSSEYETLESELAKAQSIHGSSQPDWHKVLETSEGLLRQQSKDLRVAVWLTWALHQRESYPGLLAGLGMLRYLCEHHWSVAYPEKLRTRGAAFAWLVLRLEPLFAQGLPLQNQQPLFRAVLEQLISLDELWAKHFADDAPLLLPIRRQLAQRLERAAQDDTPAAGLSGVIAQVQQAASQLLKPEAVVNNEKDASKLLRTLQEQARPLCTWWLRQNATDLRALRLNRAACIWAGDSRCYLWRGQRLYQLSRDHSLQQQLIDRQQLSPELAQAHPGSRALTRAVGGRQPLSLEVLELRTQPADVFLLCSDGLYQGLSHRELGRAMSAGTPRQVVDRLFHDVLRGAARDDLTGVVIQP